MKIQVEKKKCVLFVRADEQHARLKKKKKLRKSFLDNPEFLSSFNRRAKKMKKDEGI